MWISATRAWREIPNNVPPLPLCLASAFPSAVHDSIYLLTVTQQTHHFQNTRAKYIEIRAKARGMTQFFVRNQIKTENQIESVFGLFVCDLWLLLLYKQQLNSVPPSNHERQRNGGHSDSYRNLLENWMRTEQRGLRIGILCRSSTFTMCLCAFSLASLTVVRTYARILRQFWYFCNFYASGWLFFGIP